MKRSTRTAYAVGIALTVSLTGCGGSDFAEEPAKDIVEAAAKDMTDLESVHLDADITSEGGNVTMDLSLDDSGTCEGSISIGGAAAEVIRIGDESWFKAEDAFWEAQAGDQAEQLIAMIGDNWVADPDDQFSSFCDLDTLLDDIGDPESLEDVESDGTEDVDGEETVKLVGVDDEGTETTAYVAVDEPHYILKIEATGDNEKGEASFSEFDEDVEVEAPADEDVVELP